jgi:hypothetical protein
VDKFNVAPELVVNGEHFAEVLSNRKVIAFGSNEDRECFNLREATEIRDWLNEVIPTPADGGADGG